MNIFYELNTQVAANRRKTNELRVVHKMLSFGPVLWGLSPTLHSIIGGTDWN